jgi:hypothetical protein
MLPGVGDLVGIEDLQNAAQGNDWGGIGLGLLSAIPGIPAIGRGGRGARRAGRLLDDAPAPSAGLLGENAPAYRVERSQDLAPTDTPESLRAQGYEIDPATNTWARTVGTEAPPVEPDYPIRAFHGSPHSFDRFSLDKIGTGEGAQAYGHGLYFAESEDVARGYRDQLQRVQPSLNVNGQRFEYDQAAALADQVGISERAAQRLIQYGATGDTASLRRFGERQRNSNFDYERADSEAMFEAADAADRLSVSPGGSMYEVGINADPNTFLDWDRPLSEQPEPVRQAYARAISRGDPLSAELLGNLSDPEAMRLAGLFPDSRGAQAYNTLASVEGQRPWENFSKDTMDSRASDRLREYGISGIRYLDGNSRGAVDVNDLRGTRSMWETALRKSPDDAYARSMFEEADAALRQAEAGLSSNYVLFDDELVKIIRKYGISGLGLGAGLSAFGYNEPAEQSLPDL